MTIFVYLSMPICCMTLVNKNNNNNNNNNKNRTHIFHILWIYITWYVYFLTLFHGLQCSAFIQHWISLQFDQTF
jgi:hypothetical protein